MKFIIELEPLDIQSELETMIDDDADISQKDAEEVIAKMQEIILTRSDISNDFWEAFDRLICEAIFQTLC